MKKTIPLRALTVAMIVAFSATAPTVASAFITPPSIPIPPVTVNPKICIQGVLGTNACK